VVAIPLEVEPSPCRVGLIALPDPSSAPPAPVSGNELVGALRAAVEDRPSPGPDEGWEPFFRAVAGPPRDRRESAVTALARVPAVRLGLRAGSVATLWDRC
jgi:hypothetical protein